ncbi:MAG: hypothetical protein JST39_00255, partial [Bacteroidetes bacterium]|nr:hypothetical protein [Bacteroidota bacterium]
MSSQAKTWRINNNAGVTADFTTFYDAMQSASVASGDTIHLESSASDYYTGGVTITKRIVVIGLGYFIDPADVSFPANPGLQAAAKASVLQGVTMGEGSQGSKFLGLIA